LGYLGLFRFGFFETVLFVSVCFDIGWKHRNKPTFLAYGFTKQTETNAKQILFRFVSVRTEIYFCLFRGHPSVDLWLLDVAMRGNGLISKVWRG
jgi:hypothetical protein